MSITLEQLQEMKNIDVRSVDRETLTDINDIKINPNKPVEEKMADYINQIKNPYCFKCDDYVIKLEFAKTQRSIEDCFCEYISSLG